MSQENLENSSAQARLFFEKARTVAETGNFDYAIDLYLEGLSRDPNAVLEGHIPLYELAQARAQKGAKKPTVLEKVKRLRGKTPLRQMINAEYLFAKDPHHLPYAEAILKAAVAAGYTKTARWIADLLFLANSGSKKPSLHLYLMLKDAYSTLGLFDRAIAACRCATKLKPQDAELADECKRLEAESTVSKGRYAQQGDFRQSLKDRETQEKLQSQDSVVKTQDYCLQAIRDARKALSQNPNDPRCILDLAQALSDLETDQSDEEAIQLLENAYKTKNDFLFKQRAGQIGIKKLRRKIREAKNALQANPDDPALRSRLDELTTQLNSAELEHYRLCVQNYPTDSAAKYEYGVRLMRDKRYDDAIPFLQEAEKDPRRKIAALDKIGLCFFHKGWFADAIDVLTRAIDSYPIADDTVAKQLRYDLALAYHESGNTEKALELYRKIAQIDFAYKDVRLRIEQLRNSKNQPSSHEGT